MMKNFFRYLLANFMPILLVVAVWGSLNLVKDDFLLPARPETADTGSFLFLRDATQTHFRNGTPFYRLTFAEGTVSPSGQLEARTPELFLFKGANANASSVSSVSLTTSAETLPKLSVGTGNIFAEVLGQKPDAWVRLAAEQMSGSANRIFLKDTVVLQNLVTGGSIVAGESEVRPYEGQANFTNSFTLKQDGMQVQGDTLTTKWSDATGIHVFHASGNPVTYIYPGAATTTISGTGTDLQNGGSITAGESEVRPYEGQANFTNSFTLKQDGMQVQGDTLTTKWSDETGIRVFHASGNPVTYIYPGATTISGTGTDLHYVLHTASAPVGGDGAAGNPGNREEMQVFGTPLRFTSISAGEGAGNTETKLSGEGRQMHIEDNNKILLLGSSGSPAFVLNEQPGKPGTPDTPDKQLLARADSIFYDVVEQTLQLSGNAFLDQDGKQATGETLFYDIKEDTFRLSGGTGETGDAKDPAAAESDQTPKDTRVHILIPKESQQRDR